jgi:hypothetical protein
MEDRPDFSTRPAVPRARWRSLGLLGLGVTLAIASLVSAIGWDRQLRRAQMEIAELRRARPPGPGQSGAREIPEAILKAIGARALLTETAQPDEVLSDLAGLMPAGVRLDGVTLAYGERLAVEMQCVADGPASYDRFLDRLAESPAFAGLEPGQEARGGGELRATVRAEYARGPGR